MLNLIREKTITLVLDRKINYVLIVAIFMCLVFYIYFANMTVHTLTLLEKNKQTNQSLSVEVSDLEAQRLLVQNSISKSLALSLGLVEINDQTFIVSKSKKTTLSFKTN